MSASEEPAEIFVGGSKIRHRVEVLGRELAECLGAIGAVEPLLVAPLDGGVVFAADLSRALPLAHTLELVEPVPYAVARRRGDRRIGHSFAPRLAVAERDVVLIDGIVDTGLTLNYLVGDIKRRTPRSLTLCTLFDRPAARVVELPLALRGFTAPDALLVGYGLAHGGRFAQLPDVHLLGDAARPRLSTAA